MKVFIHGSFLLCRPKEGGVSRPKGAGICRLRAAKPHPPFSFPRKKTGGVTVQKKGVRLAVSGLNKPFASGMGMPARGKAAFSIAIRLASLLLSAVAQRVQLFELQSGNVGGRGEHPSPFSGGSKGGILFGKRIPPLPRVPTAVGQNTAPFGHPKREYSFRCMNKKRSTNKRKLRITYHEQNENRYDHCLRTA